MPVLAQIASSLASNSAAVSTPDCTFYFVPKELATKSYPKVLQKVAKRPAKGAREARPFVDEAVLLHFALFWGQSWLLTLSVQNSRLCDASWGACSYH